MNTFIGITMFLLIITYIGVAIWCICKRKTILGSIGTSVGFLCGGAVVIPMAEAIATFICWVAVICIVGYILGLLFGI